MRLYVMGIPHEISSKQDDMMSGAFTQTLMNLTKGLFQHGDYEIIHLGHELSDTSFFHDHIPILSNKDFEVAGYNDFDRMSAQINYDSQESQVLYEKYSRNALGYLTDNINPGDYVLFFGAWTPHLYPNIKNLGGIVVDASVGHLGVYADCNVFTSYPCMNMAYGMRTQAEKNYSELHGFINYIASKKLRIVDLDSGEVHDEQVLIDEINKNLSGAHYSSFIEASMSAPRWCDDVIPIPFDTDDFNFSAEKEGYHTIVCRQNYDKGIEIAIKATKELGKRLVMIGQGNPEDQLGYKLPKHAEWIGAVGKDDRSKWMAGAELGWAPTLYSEPFGMTPIEFNLCGTPVVVTDWGGFSDTVEDGINGYKCRSFKEFVENAEKSVDLDPEIIRNKVSKYNIEDIIKEYDVYFKRINRHIQNGGKIEASLDLDRNFWRTD